MGALTDNRKRCLVDCHVSDLLLSSPSPFKKPKLSSRSPSFSILPKSASVPLQSIPSPTSSAAARRFPPAAPLPRPLHGPQRVLRSFGLGNNSSSSATFSNNQDYEMGSFFSRIRRGKQQQKQQHKLVLVGGDSATDDLEAQQGSGLGLEDYRKLVTDVQEGSSVKFDTRRFSPAVSDLTLVTQTESTKEENVVLARKINDAKVAIDSAPTISRRPVYKELYEESSKKYDSKLSSLQFEVKLTVTEIAGFRLLSDVLDKKAAKEDRHGVFTPLSDEEESEVHNAMYGRRSSEVLVKHEPSNIEITREILQCLSPGAWLNDEVINLYLDLLKERENREPKKFLRCHFFNTFFYKKLISGRAGFDFKSVRRWTTQRKLGYSLIECDKIFVPIHKEVHWCLAVIDVKGQKFQYLDSLGGMDTTALRILAKYFMEEVKDKSNKQIDTSSWKQETVGDLPLQQNGWDCGMFMLKYMDFYSRGVDLSFGQEHMPYFRKRTAKEILKLRAE